MEYGDRYADTIYVIALSFETLATVTVGQFVGNKKYDEIINIVKQGIKLLILPTLLIAIITFVIPKQFCMIFVNHSWYVQQDLGNLFPVISVLLVSLLPKSFQFSRDCGIG